MKKRIDKILIIIIVNIILIAIINLIFVFLIKNTKMMGKSIFQEAINDSEIDISGYEVEKFPSDFVRLDLNNENLSKFCGENRILFNENINKKPIVILGSSYAYGHGLKKTDTFPFILSQITKRPVYNYANCGSYLNRSLSELEEVFLYRRPERESIKNADTVIYVYMYDHLSRYLFENNLQNEYEDILKFNKFEEFLNKFFLFKYINIRIKRKQILNNKNLNHCSKYVKEVILNGYKRTKKLTPNANFIIIIYDEKIPVDNHSHYQIKLAQDIISGKYYKIEQTNGDIKIVHTKDIVGFVFDKEYKLKADIADWHPNQKVWKLFTPLFAKKYIKY